MGLRPRHDADVTEEDLGPGARLLRGWLPPAAQRDLLARCRELAEGPTRAYTPVVRGGRRMRIQMLCLGRHWNPLTYRYEGVRSDFDGQPVPALPPDLAQMAIDVARDLDLAFQPDVCILNQYPETGRLGLHQDKDESAASLAAGTPIVSISLGDTAQFLLGGTKRRDPVAHVPLQSGDAFALFGPGRLRYHGVARIFPGTAPPELACEGRFNLTFRQF
jgi:DNA oxidative demethylase